MYATFNRDDRAAAMNPVPYGSFALPERIPAEVARVVKISWDELKNIEALSGLDAYQLDDIGISHREICSLARTSAEDPRGEHRSFN
jgi:uncharacterized protein YjiS (DUF1127 family)